jgi:hypothetical protein
MLSVDYKLKGKVIAIRPSMIEFEVPETKDKTTEIEIARAILAPTPYHLNRPLIMLLEGLGVRVEKIKRFQDQAVLDTQHVGRSLKNAAALFDTRGLGSSFRLAAVMRNLENIYAGSLQEDPFYNQLLQVAVFHVLRDLKNNARIPIPGAWSLVGVADTHGFLKDKEIFACVKQPDGEVTYLEGQVLVSRSPCIHPGDVQVAMAIGRPSKHSPFAKEPLPNTVVFSIKGTIIYLFQDLETEKMIMPGERPLPSCLGGDLDGDVYNLLPLAILTNMTSMAYPEPAKYICTERKKLDQPSTMKDVADFVMEYIISDVSARVLDRFGECFSWRYRSSRSLLTTGWLSQIKANSVLKTQLVSS